MEHNHILSLLGLALRGGNLTVGEEPVSVEVQLRHARLLLLASDAADHTRRRCESFARTGECLWIRVPFTKEEMGRAVGRASVALMAITDIGLANAVVQRLAQLDPAQYDSVSQRLQTKAKRAAERKSQRQAEAQAPRKAKKNPEPAAKAAPAAEEPRQKQAAHSGGPNRNRPAGPDRPASKRRTASDASGRRSSGFGHGKEDRRSSDSGSARFEKRNRPRAKPNPYENSRPVKKGKGSFRKKEV